MTADAEQAKTQGSQEPCFLLSSLWTLTWETPIRMVPTLTDGSLCSRSACREGSSVKRGVWTGLWQSHFQKCGEGEDVHRVVMPSSSSPSAHMR